MNATDTRALEHLIKFFREDKVDPNSAPPLVQELCQEALKWKSRKLSPQRPAMPLSSDDSIVYIKDNNLTYTYGNENFNRLFQLAPGELQGLTDVDLFGAEAAQEIQGVDQDLLAAPRTISFESDRMLNDKLVAHETTKAVYRDDAGNPAGIIGISRDITQKRLQAISQAKILEADIIRNQRKFELLFNKSIDASFVIRVVNGDPKDLLEVNDAACRLLGYDRDELEAMGPGDVLPLEINAIDLKEPALNNSEWYPFRRTMLYRKDNSTVRVDLGFHLTSIGEDQVLLAIARDMTEHEQAYESVRNSERKLRALFNAVPDMVININKSGKILGQKLSHSGKSGANVELLFGADALRKMDLVFDLLPPEAREPARETIERVLQTQKNETIEFQTRGTMKRGRIRDFEARICPIDQEEIVVFVREITNRKRRDAAISRSEKRLRLLYNSNPMMIINFDFDQRILSVNNSTLEALRYQEGDLLLRPREELIHPDDRALAEEHFLEYIGDEVEGYSGCEYRMLRKNGEFFWVEERAKVTEDLKGRRTVVISCEDITRRRKAEQAILESLKEKEILLREVHHRVKNNLQIINSVLSLQMAQHLDPELHQALKDSQNRILAMSLIHENLYRSEGISNIDAREYFRELCGHLFATYNISANDIKVEFFIENITLKLAHGIPLGLIANELVTNVIKYAFKDMGSSGKVIIALKEDAENVHFSFSDNGVGLPDGFDPSTSRSMGLRLIQILSRQLRGTVAFKSENGLSIELSFPKKEVDF